MAGDSVDASCNAPAVTWTTLQRTIESTDDVDLEADDHIDLLSIDGNRGDPDSVEVSSSGSAPSIGHWQRQLSLMLDNSELRRLVATL